MAAETRHQQIIGRLRAGELFGDSITVVKRAYDNNGSATIPLTRVGQEATGICPGDEVVIAIDSGAIVVMQKSRLSEEELEVIEE